MPKGKKDEADSTVLYLRKTPKDVVRKLKASAALKGVSLTDYVKELLEAHVSELEKKGLLPKTKG
jgi:plasmid stability protein